MSDNDIEENDVEEEKNNLVKVMNEIEADVQMPSIINKDELNQSSSFIESTIMNINNELNKSPYLWEDKIPEIRIKDENKLINGDNIEIYINSPFYPNINDNIYNIREKCKKSDNCFFVKNVIKIFILFAYAWNFYHLLMYR